MKLLSFPDVVIEKAFDKNNTKNCVNIWNVPMSPMMRLKKMYGVSSGNVT